MGRFYQTAKPDFIDDMTYQPPWKFVQESLATKQKGYDDALQSTEVIKNLLDVKHLNFEDDRVKNVKDYYNTQIDDLTSQLAKNPNDYNKVMPQLKNLAREIDTDRKEGNIAQIEGRYNEWQNWTKENKDLMGKEPDTYNQLANHWYTDIKNRSGEDIGAQFKGVKGLAKPELEWEKVMKDIKENELTYTDGKYYYGKEEVTPERIQDIAWNRLKSNPNFSGYIDQMGNTLGMENYKTNPFELRTKEGEVISPEILSKLTLEQRKEVGRYINTQNPFSSDLAMATGISAYSKEGVKKADEYGLEGTKFGHNKALQNIKDKAAKDRLDIGNKSKMDLLIKKYELMGNLQKDKFKIELETNAAAGDPEAQKQLDIITAKETIGVINNSDTAYEKDMSTIMSNREQGVNVPQDGKSYFSAVPGTSAYEENYRLKQATTEAKTKLGNSPKAKAYLDWLGDRTPTEETAKNYLESKGVYQKKGPDVSIGAETINNARWTPGFVKSDQAKQWDEIYSIGEKYKENINSWYNKENKKSIQVSVNPLTTEGKGIILNELNSNSENYFTTDKDGNATTLTGSNKIQLKDIVGVTGGNSQSNIGYQVIDESGNKQWIFPSSSNSNVVSLNRNLSLMGVADKNSSFAKEAISKEVNRIKTDILKGTGQGDNVKTNIISIPGGRVVMKMLPNGNVEVYDENGNKKIDTYSSVNQFVEYLYK